MTAPDATPEQRRAALEKATETRRARADTLAAVRAGTVDPVDVLTEPNEVDKGIRVARLLKAVPGHGPVKADKLMGEAAVSRTRKVGGLGARQRAKLAQALGS